MDTVNLKEHLNLLKIKDIKNLIRQYNLHYKIKLSQKKPELISDLLKHFEENIIDNNVTSKKYDITVPKIEEPKIEESKLKPKIKEVVKVVVKEVKIKQPEDDDDRMQKKKEKLEDKAKLLRIAHTKEWDNYQEISKKINKVTEILVDKFIKGFKTPPEKSTITRYKDYEMNRDKTMYDLNIQEKESLLAQDRMGNEMSKIIYKTSFRNEPKYSKLARKRNTEELEKALEELKAKKKEVIKKDVVKDVVKKDESNRLHIKIIVPSKSDDGYVENFKKLTKLEQLNIVLKTSTITGKAPKKDFYVEIADEFYKNINILLNRSPYSAVKELVDKYQLTAENLKKMYAAKSSSDFFPTGYEMVKQIFNDGQFSKYEYDMLEGTAGIGGVGYWAKRINPNLNITMNELNKNNYDIMKLFNDEKDDIDLMNDDFFKLNNNRGYDLIFLNPPFGSIANKNPNFWFLFLLQALHLLKDVKGPSYILFISPQLIRPRQNADSKDVQFESLFDLIKGYKQDNDQEGLLLANRWLNYINKFSGKSFTSTDIEKGFYDREGKLYDYIEDNFKIQYAVSVPLKSTDFGGTKLQAYYTLFELYNK